jgi:hypothetical protein
MSDEERFEQGIKQLATAFKYPPTPDMARPDVRQGRLDWRLAVPMAVLIAAVAVVITVPPVRAALAEVFGLGSVEIVLGEPTPAGSHPASPGSRFS